VKRNDRAITTKTRGRTCPFKHNLSEDWRLSSRRESSGNNSSIRDVLLECHGLRTGHSIKVGGIASRERSGRYSANQQLHIPFCREGGRVFKIEGSQWKASVANHSRNIVSRLKEVKLWKQADKRGLLLATNGKSEIKAPSYSLK